MDDQLRWQDLVESMRDGVVVFNLDEQVLVANSVLREITQVGVSLSAFWQILESEQVKDTVVAEIAPGRWSKIALHEMSGQVLRSGRELKIDELVFKGKTYELVVLPVRHDEHVSGGAVILHDISHLKEMEMMKTEFISMASHQLRMPLTAMRLFMESLKDPSVGVLNDKQREYVDSAYESTLRMVELVHELLNVTHLENGRLRVQPKMTQLEDFLEKVVHELVQVAEQKGKRLVYIPETEKLTAMPLDTSLLYHVVHNFITNAIRYTKDLIEVRCEVRTLDSLPRKRQIALAGMSGSVVLIRVKDNGIGVPDEVGEHIFEKFYRAENAQRVEAEGSGLGLYLVKMIADLIGAKIGYDSPPLGEDGTPEEQGSEFWLAMSTFGMRTRSGEKGLYGK